MPGTVLKVRDKTLSGAQTSTTPVYWRDSHVTDTVSKVSDEDNKTVQMAYRILE